MVEGQMLQRKARLMSKLPEIQKALDIVTVLHEQGSAGDMVLDYELAESVYAKTRVSKVKHVNLWLGADVMVEYGLDEAKELLTNNLANCKANILNCNKDLEVVKDNLTTLESLYIDQFSMADEYDLVTIGAGSGGVRASRFAAQLYNAK
ncbi:prefoldin subunit 3, partial [Haematococcus lacustris]